LGGSWSVAYAINDAGQMTGTAQTPAGEPAFVGHAFLYSNGQMTDLGTLGGLYSLGFGINSSGQVVGQASTDGGFLDAFLYSDGTMTDLNDLVDLSASGLGKLYGAQAINDRGQILAGACATASNCTGLGHTLLLTPVPEPANLTLFGAVLLVLGTRMRLRIAHAPTEVGQTNADSPQLQRSGIGRATPGTISKPIGMR
jgi:probable HAF family extracellular repeat protein